MSTCEAQEHGMRAPAPPELVPGLRWRRVFPGDERQPGELRRWLAALLPDTPARDDITLVASELANNAIRHTASGRDGWFAAEVTWHGSMVLVAVADGGGPSVPHLIAGSAAENGRGLQLVHSLSMRSGWCGDERGRLVWAHIPWQYPGTEVKPPREDPYEAAIREGKAALATRFGDVPAWFGRCTLQWWALGPAGLVTAPTAQELAAQIRSLTGARTGTVAASQGSGQAPPVQGQRSGS